MDKKLGQEPAFAIPGNDYRTEAGSKYHLRQIGMSKRFYAVCAAMQGLAANLNGFQQKNGEPHTSESFIKNAYILADELLKQENE